MSIYYLEISCDQCETTEKNQSSCPCPCHSCPQRVLIFKSVMAGVECDMVSLKSEAGSCRSDRIPAISQVTFKTLRVILKTSRITVKITSLKRNRFNVDIHNHFKN